MAHRLSFRPSLTLKGRKFFGPLRGWAGKPVHPPLTDIPIAAYMLAAAFDVISAIWKSESWSQEMFHAAGWVMIGGVVVSLGAALTGYWDWLKSTSKGTQVRRTANAHAWTMLTVTALVLISIAIRIGIWDDAEHAGRPRGPVRRDRGPRGARRDDRRHAGVRLRVQRAHGRRPPRVPPVGCRPDAGAEAAAGRLVAPGVVDDGDGGDVGDVRGDARRQARRAATSTAAASCRGSGTARTSRS